MSMIQATELIVTSRKRVKAILERKNWPNRTGVERHRLIRLYTAAFAVNFTDWMGKTLPWVRHEDSRRVLTDNLRCEAGDDHIGLLLAMAKDCMIVSGGENALPRKDDFEEVSIDMKRIREFFRTPVTAGLAGMTLMTILENTSREFIPVLGKVATSLNCAKAEYIEVHGEADAKHSEAFLAALQSEVEMGYSPEDLRRGLHGVYDTTHGLLETIFG